MYVCVCVCATTLAMNREKKEIVVPDEYDW